jgi:PAS domain S-box-containing protein
LLYLEVELLIYIFLAHSRSFKSFNETANWFLSKPRLTGFLFFLFLLTFVVLIVFQRYELYIENKKQEVAGILAETEQNIEQSLKNYYTVSLTLALTIDDKGVPKNFNSVAEKLIKSTPQLQAVQLVPNGVIKYIYPLKGNEQALNLDLFKSVPRTVMEAKKAIQTKNMYYQGPVKLYQGGVGLVGRLPVFINGQFWGFSAVVIKLDTFFKASGIDNTKHKNYRFQFSKINSDTKEEEFFLTPDPNFNFEHAKSIVFPDGDWKLYVSFIDKHDVWLQLISTIVFGLSLAVLSSYLLTRLIIKQRDLQHSLVQKEQVLIKTESKYKGIFDNAAIGIARVNTKTGALLEVNKYLCDFLEFTEEELINRKIKSLIHPEDVVEDSRIFKLYVNGEVQRITNEKRYISKNNHIKWGSVTITPLWKDGEEPNNHIIILEDSTERKAAAQVLIESQQRIQSLINTIDGIVWESYLDNLEPIFISEKVQDILGYSAEEWMSAGNSWITHLHPDDKESMIAYLSSNISKNKQLDGSYRMMAKDGSIVWIRDIVTVINEEGKPSKLRGIMIDITTQHQAEVALNNSFNLVTEQNKRLLNFSYIVSHNLRSHASNINGIISLIENAATPDERNEMFQLLKTVAENLNETLLNLNNVVNIQSSIDIIVEPLNLNDYIKKTLDTLNAQILSKGAVIVNNLPENILVNYNRAYLESILLNLISNSIRYSESTREPYITLSFSEENNQQVLIVSDNGIGIDLKKNREKLFGMYQTFNGNPDARGYGLFITKNQIEALGGRIEVESELDKGTTFKVYFK